MAGCSITLTSLSHVFALRGSPAVHALSNLSLAIPPGEFVVVVGANGSGKSTLLRIIAGDLEPTSGSVVIQDDTAAMGVVATGHGRVAQVHQSPDDGVVADLTVLDNLRLAAMRTRFAFPWRLQPLAADLAHFTQQVQPRLGVALTARVGDLSQGQRQLLAMELAVLRRPGVLLLDEHTASLDQANAIECLRSTGLLALALGVTIVMVTHNFSDAAAFGDRLIVLRSGTVSADVSGDEKRALRAIDVFALCGFHAGTAGSND